MKRAISTFLLMLVLVTSIQPTLAMHFCGGRLHSVGLINGSPGDSCCGEPMENDFQAATGNSAVISDPFVSCCSNRMLTIATDHFQLQQEPALDAPPLTFSPFFLLANDLLKTVAPNHSQVFQHTFPPGGLAKQHLDLLAWVCIFRI